MSHVSAKRILRRAGKVIAHSPIVLVWGIAFSIGLGFLLLPGHYVIFGILLGPVFLFPTACVMLDEWAYR